MSVKTGGMTALITTVTADKWLGDVTTLCERRQHGILLPPRDGAFLGIPIETMHQVLPYEDHLHDLLF